MPIIPAFGVLLNSINIHLSECCLLWTVARQAPKRDGLFSIGVHWLVGQAAVQVQMEHRGPYSDTGRDLVFSKPPAGRDVRR